jgi:hypothetical protein
MQVKIIKDYKMMKVGDTPNVDEAYAIVLIKKGVVENPEKAAKAEKK